MPSYPEFLSNKYITDDVQNQQDTDLVFVEPIYLLDSQGYCITQLGDSRHPTRRYKQIKGKLLTEVFEQPIRSLLTQQLNKTIIYKKSFTNVLQLPMFEGEPAERYISQFIFKTNAQSSVPIVVWKIINVEHFT